MPKPTLARELKFSTFDDILAEAKRIAAQPGVSSRGSWTPAQNVWHVGRVVLASVEGFPADVPFIFKLVGPLLRNRFTKRAFNPGIKVPAKLAAHFVADSSVTADQAVELFEQAVAKRQAQGYIPASPLFGKMTEQQWEQLHCRHAEMHFGLIELKD